MGVYFLKSKRVEDNYDKVLFENDHNNRNGTISSVDILTEIDMGRDEAIKVNLNFGLKSYLHEESPFQTFARDALDSPRGSVSECSEAPSERETLVATAPAACACINCACHGANGSLIAAALLALESGLQTNKRSIRAMDFYGTLRPRGLLKDDERVEMIRVPKCGGYTCGCVTIEGMPEIADGVTPLALVYAFALMKGRFFDARIVVAGAAAVPVRQIEIERGLRGKPATREAVQELGRELFGDSANALKIVDIMKGWFAE